MRRQSVFLLLLLSLSSLLSACFRSPSPDGHNHVHNDYDLAEKAKAYPPFIVDKSTLRVAALDELDELGQWGPITNWPFAFATAANLPDGRIIAWGGNNLRSFSGGTTTYASIWNPATGQFQSVNRSDHSMFCAIPTMLEDGRVFVNGGDGTRERTSIFDFRTNQWSRVENMNVGRWYNGAVALPNGQVFTALGDPGGRYPELYSAGLGWRYLSGADLQAPILNFSGYQHNWLPYLYLAPNGQIFHAGPTTQMNYINPSGNGSVVSANLTNSWYPKYSAAVMYDEGKMLVAGGQINGSNLAATNQAMMIDLSGTTPQKTVIGSMTYARKFHNGVVLPNGEVLIVGGNTSGIEFSDQGTILTPELWNPNTRTWRSLADMSVPRNYHSVALLMPDGRVWSGGGGLCNCAADHLNHQIYSPPYLFNPDGSLATRPTISSAPNATTPGSVISLQASAGLQTFSLIKMSGTTHNLNSDLRRLNVPFNEISSGQYQLMLHSNQNVLTPGYWMLFALNAQGVPSVAKVIQVNKAPPPVTTPGPNRYVRFEGLSEVNGNPWASAAEVNVLDGNANAILRSNWTVTADSAEAANPAVYATDGNSSTFWHTLSSGSPYPHALTIDLGAGYTLSGLKYLPRQDTSTHGTIAAYRVYVSGDGNTWTQVAQGSFANNKTEKTLSFASTLSLNPLTSAPRPTGTSITYTASFSGGLNPRFKWSFGDGSPETAYSSSTSTSHSYSQPGRYIVTLTANDDTGTLKTIQFVQAVHLPLTSKRPNVSMSIAYEDRTSTDRVWVVNPDNDSVSILNADTHAKLAEINVGKAPRAIAIAPDGRVWVTNKEAATISIIDPSSLSIAQTLTMPYGSQPFGLVFDPNGSFAYVVLEGSARVLKLSAATGSQSASLNVGTNPRHISVSADGSKVYVSRFITPPIPGEATASPQLSAGGAEVLVISSSSLTLSKTILLRHSNASDTDHSARGIPNYLGPVVVSPDGRSAWVPSKQDNIARGSLRDGRNLSFESTVRSISSRLDLATESEDLAARLDHDDNGVTSTGSFDGYGVYLFVALESSREVAIIDAYAKAELLRFDVGRAPQGLVISPDGRKLFVQNFMDRSVGVYDVAKVILEGKITVTNLATISTVASERLSSQVLLGKQFFYDARDPRLARDSYLSCASCHNDGGQDGRIWDFTGFGEGLRNTISLRGRAGAQGRLHWSANFDEVQDFEGQIRNFADGTGLMSNSAFNETQNPLGAAKAGRSSNLDALAAYVSSLNAFDNSPFRSNGSLTSAGNAGKTVFQNANCAQCHLGNDFSDSAQNSLHNIGTLKPSSGSRSGGTLSGIDTPTLRDVWATAPYLHDGSASTLADAVRAHSGISLSSTDLNNLAAYLSQIDGSEPAPAGVNSPPSISNPGNQSNTVGDSVSLQISATDPNGDSLSYSASGLPGGLSIGSSTGHISGTLSAAGSFSVTVTVNDGRGGLANTSFSWTVASSGSTQTFSTRVSNSSDDAEEETATGLMKITSTDLELGRETAPQLVGIRFRNVTIPRGATISRAYIVFTVDEAGTEATSVTIRAEAVGNPVGFSTSTGNISSRSLSTAQVSWNNIPSWTTLGSTQQSPELKTIVQELVNLTNWQSGNAMVFVISGTGQRVAESYNGAAAAAPQLVIEYSDGGSSSNSLDLRISSGADDAEESSSGVISRTSTDLELTTDATQQVVGLHFNNLNIPQGATISNAYLQFKVDEVSSEATNLIIQAHASDNATPLSYTTNDLSSRPRTTASSNWSVASWTSVGAAGAAQRSPNIAAVIQEVINRPGWQAGNSLVILISGTGKRVAESYEGDVAGAPLLHIDWQ